MIERLCVWCGKRDWNFFHEICWSDFKKWMMRGEL